MPHILVVDDEPSVLAMVRMVLELEGHVVETVDDGEQALAALDLATFDLVLLDVMMPGLSGFEVAREIRARRDFGNVPVVFVSAKAEREDIWTGWQLGADSYLTKPFDTDELVSEVCRVLGNRGDLRNQGARHPQVEHLIVLGEA